MILRASLTRRQLASIQVARGIPAQEIQQRTGIPRASYEVVFSSTHSEQDKEVTKMLSKTTFDRLIALLGIETDFCGLRHSGVLEWRAEGTAKKTSQAWVDAASALIKELLTDRLLFAEVLQRGREGWLARFSDTERMLLIYDRARGIRIAITRAPADLLGKLEALTGVTCQRKMSLSPAEFRDTREMIHHEVYRSVQFDHLTGVIQPTYTWKDVQAASREFGFSTDDLVNMMHETAERRSAPKEEPMAAGSEADETESQSVGFSDRHNTDFQVARLRVVG